MFVENRIYCAADFRGAFWRALQYQYNELTEITAVLITGKFKKLRLVLGFSKCQWTQLITTHCHGESSQVMLSRPLLSNSKEDNERKINEIKVVGSRCQIQPLPLLSASWVPEAGECIQKIKPQAFRDVFSLWINF